jgi:hypothetical protein
VVGIAESQPRIDIRDETSQSAECRFVRSADDDNGLRSEVVLLNGGDHCGDVCREERRSRSVMRMRRAVERLTVRSIRDQRPIGIVECLHRNGDVVDQIVNKVGVRRVVDCGLNRAAQSQQLGNLRLLLCDGEVGRETSA